MLELLSCDLLGSGLDLLLESGLHLLESERRASARAGVRGHVVAAHILVRGYVLGVPIHKIELSLLNICIYSQLCPLVVHMAVALAFRTIPKCYFHNTS